MHNVITQINSLDSAIEVEKPVILPLIPGILWPFALQLDDDALVPVAADVDVAAGGR